MRQVPPTIQRTMEGNDVHARVQPRKRNTRSVVLRTNCETCVGELGPRSDCSCTPVVRRASGTIHPFEPHPNTALSHVQRSCNGRARGIPSYVCIVVRRARRVCAVVRDVCAWVSGWVCCCDGCHVLCMLRVGCRACRACSVCVVACVVCHECVVTRVVHVARALSLVSCMSCVFFKMLRKTHR